jgi:hypothetical protein
VADGVDLLALERFPAGVDQDAYGVVVGIGGDDFREAIAA